jgi:ribonuclease HII
VRRAPSLRRERALLAAGARVVVGMDEVGRGALAGPVSVGVVAVGARTRTCPRGVADSKLLSPAARTALLPALAGWGLARAVGHASAAEIDAIGIIGALGLAGRRALAQLAGIGAVFTVLLDGSYDWLSVSGQGPGVALLVKADRTCSSVAAASVLAKCERDAVMTGLAAEHPAYGWADNKGYGSPDHLAALRRCGPSPLHRVSWRLPVGP